MHPLITRAKKRRGNYATKKLSDLEEKILKAFGIDIDGCLKIVDSLVKGEQYRGEKMTKNILKS